MNEKKKLLILSGPTAAGKTELSIEIAKKLNGEIISADSMQVYRHMDIGTAKVTPSEMQGVPHHLIDIIEPTEAWNVMLFQQEAKKKIDEIASRGHLPILVGGTGFYIQSVVYDIDFIEEETDLSYRDDLRKLLENGGPDALFWKLREVDPESAEIIHGNNVKRVMRALEFFHETGKKISEHNKAEREKESPYDFQYFCLYRDREKMYERIEKRVDRMMEKGLLSEVIELKNRGCTSDMTSMQGLGYRQVLRYLDGKCDLSTAVSDIKTETRHFAKRQMTWFRREKEICFLDLDKENFFDVYRA